MVSPCKEEQKALRDRHWLAYQMQAAAITIVCIVPSRASHNKAQLTVTSPPFFCQDLQP